MGKTDPEQTGQIRRETGRRPAVPRGIAGRRIPGPVLLTGLFGAIRNGDWFHSQAGHSARDVPPAISILPRQFYRDTIRILILFPLFFNSPTVYCPAGSCANACLSHLSYSHSETAIVDSRIQTVYPYRVHISPSESKRCGSHLLCKDSDAFSFNTRQEGGTVQYIITGSDRFALFRIKTQVRAESHSTTQYKKISGSHRNTRFPGVLL